MKKKWYGLLAASMLCLAAAACGSSSLVAPEDPRFDGGSTAGSGHTESTLTVTTTSDTTLGSSGTVDRGGHTLGSGN
jgi:ABC-type glycerol-3-phosphate transport system substrate-binding protein